MFCGVAALAASDCSCDDKATIVEWHILAHRAPGEARDRRWMAWLRQGDDEVYRLDPDRLSFEPKWGIEYRLDVRFRDPSSGIFGDVAGLSRGQLLRIKSEVSRADTEFEIPDMGAPWLGEDRRTFVDGQAFTCPDPEVCARLDALAEDPAARFTMKMRHGAAPGVVELLGF